VQDLAREFQDGGRIELYFEFRDPTYVTGMEVVTGSGVSVDVENYEGYRYRGYQ
jgi:hypothetical protein